jgi:glycopeptide antibiotics resistance protein
VSSHREQALRIAAGLYAVALALITVIPLRATNDRATRLNLAPLGSIRACLVGQDGRRDSPGSCVRNLAGNVLLFVPFGVLFALGTGPDRRSFASAVMWAVLASATIELIQWQERMLHVGRTVDVDDILWNAVGAAAGYGVVVASAIGRQCR